MSRTIMTEHAAIEAALERIGSALQAIEGELDALEQRANRLRAQWDGEAAEAYELAQRDWNASLRSLRRIATALNAVAASGNRRFADFDRASARAWAI